MLTSNILINHMTYRIVCWKCAFHSSLQVLCKIFFTLIITEQVMLEMHTETHVDLHAMWSLKLSHLNKG